MLRRGDQHVKPPAEGSARKRKRGLRWAKPSNFGPLNSRGCASFRYLFFFFLAFFFFIIFGIPSVGTFSLESASGLSSIPYS
jgi:hypothetical protein